MAAISEIRENTWRISSNRRQRPQQFVGRLQILEALTFKRQGGLQSAEVERVVDGKRHLIRDEGQEGHIGAAVLVRLPAASDQHPDASLRRNQGKAADRPSVLMPQVLHLLRKPRLVRNGVHHERYLMSKDPVGELVL